LQGGKVCHAFVNKRKDKDMEKISMKETVSGLPVINFHAAGMDAGSMLMAASYTGAAREHCMYSTRCFTKDLNEPVEELKREGITDAAMEATGVFTGRACMKCRKRRT
jgi:hypothetical protein